MKESLDAVIEGPEELADSLSLPDFSRGHEIANILTHGFGLALSVVGGVILILLAAMRGDGWHLASCATFAGSLSLLYASSTLYHSSQNQTWKHFFRIADHACIYLLIAGSYTPFTLTVMRGSFGWRLFLGVWAAGAHRGMSENFFQKPLRSSAIFNLSGDGMDGCPGDSPDSGAHSSGWIVLLAAGGLSYTLGIFFLFLTGFPTTMLSGMCS
ncbi:MAG: hemolysin-III related [Candidatus Hinthialibacteria bacterium OLB16]|nr:MAG: hemolysin-III related [Candidatus Hinthialibacteria bacterium OLB16]